MKIVCTSCNGYKHTPIIKVPGLRQDGFHPASLIKCPDCDGKGWNEAERLSGSEMHYIEIGRATEKAFEGIYAELLIHDIWPSGDNKGTERIASVAELLEWATQEGKAGDETTLYDKEHEKVKYCMACGAKFAQEEPNG